MEDKIPNIVQLNIKAPVFKLKDAQDRLVDLETYKGKKVLIGFFRHAGCPFCNLRVHELFKAQMEGKFKNMEMIFFFESGIKTIQQSSFLPGLSPIPIISDPEKVWYSIYGIENSALKSAFSHLTGFIQTAIKAKFAGLPIHPMKDGESISTMPAEFLLDENLIIRKLHYSQGLLDRMPLSTIQEFAENEG